MQLFFKTDEIECKEVAINPRNEDEVNFAQFDVHVDDSLLQNKDENNATVYCNDVMDMTGCMPSGIIACHNQDTDFLDDDALEITENLPLFPCKNSTTKQINKTDLLKDSRVNSTELTVAISELLTVGFANKELQNTDKQANVSFNTENIAQMEFTSVLPSSTWIRPNSLCQSDRRTKEFGNETMEFTCSVVPSTDQCKNQDEINILENNDKENNVIPMVITQTKTIEDKTKIFIDKSVEETEAICVNIEICKEKTDSIQRNATEIFSNKSIEITEVVVSNLENYNKIQNDILLPDDDKSKIFYNKSIDETEAVQVNIEKCNEFNPPDKTKIYFDNSMEITEAITNFEKKLDSPKNNDSIIATKAMSDNNATENSFKEKISNNSILLQNSMEMTEMIPTFGKFGGQSNCIFKEPVQNNKTNIYANNSMEMTEAIQSLKPTDFETEMLNLSKVKEKTQLLDASMEMTEAIPPHVILQTNEKVSDQIELFDNTKICADTSMEMTEAINVHTINQRQENLIDDNLKIISNESMEITEAVINLQKNHQPIDQNPVYNEEYENKSITNKMQRKSLSKRRSVYDKPREINESLVSKDIVVPQDIQHEKTQVFVNESVNLTQANDLPSCSPLNVEFQQDEAEILEKNKTITHNKSNNTSCHIDEHTKESLNTKPTEVTEIISVYQDELDLNVSNYLANENVEKTKNVSINSTNMTETSVISNTSRSSKQKNITNKESQIIDGNQTSAILQTSSTSNQHCTGAINVYHDDSMEITEGLSLAANMNNNNNNDKMYEKENSKIDYINSSANVSKSLHDTSNKSKVHDIIDVSSSIKLTNYVRLCDSTVNCKNKTEALTSQTPILSKEDNNISRKNDRSYDNSIWSSNQMDVVLQNTNHFSNFDNLEDTNFHRITADELNNLCASINLPIHKYTSENSNLQNSNAQSSSIPKCCDVNVLRESMRNGTLYQSVQKTFETSTSKNSFDQGDGTKLYRETNFDVISSPTKSKSTITMDYENFVPEYDNILSTSITNRLIEMDIDKTSQIVSKKILSPKMIVDEDVEFNLLDDQLPELPSLSMYEDDDDDDDEKTNKLIEKDAHGSSSFIQCLSENEKLIQDQSNTCLSRLDKSLAQDFASVAVESQEESVKNSNDDLKKVDNASEKSNVIYVYQDDSLNADAPVCGKRKSVDQYETLAKKNPTVILTDPTLENIKFLRKRKKELQEELKIWSKKEADVEALKKKLINKQKVKETQPTKTNVEKIIEKEQKVVEEPLTPFLQLEKNMKEFEKRYDKLINTFY